MQYFFRHKKREGESSLLDNAIENGYNDNDWNLQKCDESGVRYLYVMTDRIYAERF